MKYYLLLLLMVVTTHARATNYFVSAKGNDANAGTSPATPWQTLSKINGSRFSAGDSIFLKRGDVFYGSLIVPRNSLYFGAYGTGDLPTISGASIVSKWMGTGAGKYYTMLDASNQLNMVSLNGKAQIIARQPNADAANKGYIPYRSLASRTPYKIRGVTEKNREGKIMVVKVAMWRIGKVDITAQQNDTISFRQHYSIGNGSSGGLEPGQDNYGYFYMQDTTYLDQLGEWVYLGRADKRLYMYFGDKNPNEYTIKVATVDTLINIASKTNITISQIRLEYGNLYGIYGTTTQQILIDGCEINNIGAQGIGFSSLYRSTVSNNVISNCMQTGIFIRGTNSPFCNITIRGNDISNIGRYPGMGSFNQGGDYCGIFAYVKDTLTVANNKVKNIGLDGIWWQGSNAVIRNNWVENFVELGLDKGGIYTYWDAQDASANYVNRKVVGNFVSNGSGAKEGTTNTKMRVEGIYLDGITSNVDVDSNVVWNLPNDGIELNIGHNVRVRDNIIIQGNDASYTNGQIISVQQGTHEKIRNFEFKRNTCFVSKPTQIQMNIQIAGLEGNAFDNIRAMGVFDENYVNRTTSNCWRTEVYPASPNAVLYNFSQWKSQTNLEGSSKSLPDISSENLLLVTNWSASPSVKKLEGTYIDKGAVKYSGSVTLPPYGSKLLFLSTK